MENIHLTKEFIQIITRKYFNHIFDFTFVNVINGY